MDFVISKVAASICALLVVSILSGLLGSTQMVDDASELKNTLRQLCRLVDRAVRSGSESVLEWTVPTLSDGHMITLILTSGAVRGEAGSSRDTYQPAAPLHLWHHAGEELNRTQVQLLDRDTPELRIESGHEVVVTTKLVVFENALTLFAFVLPG